MRFLVVASVLALSIWPSTVEGDARKYVLLFMNNDPVEGKSPGEDGYGHFAKVHVVSSSNDDGCDFNAIDWTKSIFDVPEFPTDLPDMHSISLEKVSLPGSEGIKPKPFYERIAENPRRFTVTEVFYTDSYPEGDNTKVEKFEDRRFFFNALQGLCVECLPLEVPPHTPSNIFYGYVHMNTHDKNVEGALDLFKVWKEHSSEKKKELNSISAPLGNDWKTKKEWGDSLREKLSRGKFAKFFDFDVFLGQPRFPEEFSESERNRFRLTTLDWDWDDLYDDKVSVPPIVESEKRLCFSDNGSKEEQEYGKICEWTYIFNNFAYYSRWTFNEESSFLSLSNIFLAARWETAVKSFLSYATPFALQPDVDRPESYSAPVKAMKNPTKKKNKKKNMKKKRGRRNRKRFH